MGESFLKKKDDFDLVKLENNNLESTLHSLEQELEFMNKK